MGKAGSDGATAADPGRIERSGLETLDHRSIRGGAASKIADNRAQDDPKSDFFHNPSSFILLR